MEESLYYKSRITGSAHFFIVVFDVDSGDNSIIIIEVRKQLKNGDTDIPVCILRSPRKYCLSNAVIRCCCSAWSVWIVSCHSRNFVLLSRTISFIWGHVAPFEIFDEVPGLLGAVKSYVVSFFVCV